MQYSLRALLGGIGAIAVFLAVFQRWGITGITVLASAAGIGGLALRLAYAPLRSSTRTLCKCLLAASAFYGITNVATVFAAASGSFGASSIDVPRLLAIFGGPLFFLTTVFITRRTIRAERDITAFVSFLLFIGSIDVWNILIFLEALSSI